MVQSLDSTNHNGGGWGSRKKPKDGLDLVAEIVAWNPMHRLTALKVSTARFSINQQFNQRRPRIPTDRIRRSRTYVVNFVFVGLAFGIWYLWVWHLAFGICGFGIWHLLVLHLAWT